MELPKAEGLLSDEKKMGAVPGLYEHKTKAGKLSWENEKMSHKGMEQFSCGLILGRV